MFSLSNTKQLGFLKEHWIITSVLLWSGLVCFLFVLYVAHGITRTNSIITACLFGIICAALIKFFPKQKNRSEKIDASIYFGYAASILLYLGLAVFAFLQRTDIALRSPWEVLPVWFFVVYALSLILLLGTLYRDTTRNFLSIFALIAHTGLTYGIALLTFRFGYAYDPLIHQTAEKYVALHGHIDPLQPFYIGQYALVTFFHFITTLPIEIIDRMLIPLLAAISVPLVGVIGLREGWNLSERTSRIAVVALTCFPIAEFTFTVPHNLTVLYALWWILLLPLALRTTLGRIMLFLLTCAICAIHPLIGVPLVITTLTAFAASKFYAKTITTIGAIVIGVSLPLMFGFYRFLQGIPFFTTINPLVNTDNFFNIFAFNAALENLSIFYKIIYGFNYALPFVIIIFGFYFAYKNTQVDRNVRLTLSSLTVGIIIAIFFVSTLIYIPGIALHEQNEFMFRLRSALPLFLLPIVLVSIIQNYKNSISLKIFFCACIILIAPVSLYFSYPRVDGATWPGWNVSRSDIDAVQGIAKIAGGAPYIVLSHQVMAAAGLREIGFEGRLVTNEYDTHRYPIGITEMIHPFAEQILYSHVDGSELRALAEIIDGTVFVAVHDYWYRSPEIIAEAFAQNPNDFYTFGQVKVFTFTAE